MLVGMFADSHCSDREVSCRTRRPSLSYGKIAAALDAFTAAGAQAVIMLGDLMDSCVDPADNVRELERTGALICSAGLPVYCLRGNHDCDILSAADFYAACGFAAPPFSVAKGGRALIFLDGCFTVDDMPPRRGRLDRQPSSRRTGWTARARAWRQQRHRRDRVHTSAAGRMHRRAVQRAEFG